MKTIYSFILFLIMNLPLLAEENQIKLDWLITDYKGIAVENDRIFCYGNHGIITYSQDKGKTWKQLTVDSRINIYKIWTNKNGFCGISDYGLLISNDGTYWRLVYSFESPRFKNGAKAGSIIYAIIDNSFCSFNLDDNIILPQVLIELEEDTYYQMESDGENIYFNSNSKLFRYDISSKNLTEREMDRKDFFDVSSDFKIKCLNNELYTMWERSANGNNTVFFLFKSEDKGLTWKFISKNIFSPAILEEDNSLYSISRNYKYNLLVPYYEKIDSITNLLINNDSITKAASSNDLMSYDKIFIYDIKRIDSETLIAAGDNKMILMSENNGKNWRILSYFNVKYYYQMLNELNPFGAFVSDSIFYCLTDNAVYSTSNAGATWLPNNYNNGAETIKSITAFNFDKNNGYILVDNSDTNDFNVLKTEDYANSFSKANKSDSLDFKNMIWNKKAIKTDDKYLYIYRKVNEAGDFIGNVSVQYDMNYNLLTKADVPLKNLRDIIKIDNSYFIAFGYNFEGDMYSLDSLFPNLTFSFDLYRSTDGITWQKIDTDIPLYTTVRKQGVYFVKEVEFNRMFEFQGDLFFLTNNNIYTYNIQFNKFDSLNVSFKNVVGYVYKDKCHYLINKDNIYYTRDIFSPKFDSVSISDYLKNYNLQGINKAGENVYLVATLKVDMSSYPNFIKLTLPKPTSAVENEKVADHIWASSPFPSPAKDIVSTTISWGFGFTKEDISIQLFDIVGNEVHSKINFEERSEYSANISINTEALVTGVYIMLLDFGKRKLPVYFVKQ